MGNPENNHYEASPLPSGYLAVEQLAERPVVDAQMLPWLSGPVDLGVTRCTLANGETFLLASAVGTSPKLVSAAESMTDHQKRIADNMFYSRLPTFIMNGHANNVETMASPSTPFPIKIVRNPGGQRVYFGVIGLSVGRAPERTVIRLGVCDKNRQAAVLAVLSRKNDRENRRKLSK